MNLLPWEQLLKVDRSQGDFGKLYIMKWDIEAASKLSTSAHIYNNNLFHQVFQLFHRFASSLNKSHDVMSICTFKMCKKYVFLNKCVYLFYCFALFSIWSKLGTIVVSPVVFCYFSSRLSEKMLFYFLVSCNGVTPEVWRVPILYEHLFYPPRDR